MPEILGSSTTAKQVLGFNISLLKGNTISQTIVGAIITSLVIASTIATVIMVTTGVGYSPPVAQPDVATTFKRVPITIDVLHNDYDPRGGNLTLTQIVTQPVFGTARIVSQSKIMYQSKGAFTGNDTFSYEVNNGFASTNATVRVTVLNRPPQAIPIYKKISKNALDALVDIFNFVGDNDERISDVDQDELFAVSFADQHVVSGNSQKVGSIQVDPNNGFLYTPVFDFNGVETFKYTISDGNDTDSNIITVEVDNDAPTAVDDYFRTPKYSGVRFDVLANDFDINKDDINITSAIGAGYGASSVSSKSIYYYTSSVLTTKYTDTFEYTISDGQKEGSAIVFVQVYNTEPIVFSKVVKVAKSSTNNTISVDYYDQDRKDLVTMSKVTPSLSSLNPPAKLMLTNTYEQIRFECCDWINVETNNYTIVFDPTPGFVYTQTLDITMTDGEGVGSGRITIQVVNTPPVAVDDVAECNKNQQVYVNVVANDYDENSGDTSLIELSNVNWQSTTQEGGTITLYNTTHVLYVPKKGFLGTDIAQYVISDQSKDEKGNPDTTSYSTGKLTITVINNPPTPVNDEFTISKGISSVLNVLDNDSDPNDGPGSIYVINSVTQSTVKGILASIVNNSKNILEYIAVNEEYVDYLTYDITDANGMNSNYFATVKLNVVNDAPVTVDDLYETKWNRSVTCSVKDNDLDINGDLARATISIARNPSSGTVQIVGDVIVYTPNNGFVGTDSFQYTLNDGSSANALSNVATVTVDVTNNAPVTVQDTATTHWRNPDGVFMNPITTDSDPDGDPIVLSRTSSDPSVGTSSLVSNTFLKFIPNQVTPSTGQKEVSYTVSDWNKETDGKIIVTVTNTKPISNGDQYLLHWAAPTTILNVITNDGDPDSDPISLGDVRGSTSAVKNGNTISYTPQKNGLLDTFQYSVFDKVDYSDYSTVTVNFTNNAIPVAVDVSSTIHWRVFSSQSNQQDFTVLTQTTDADGDSLTLTVTGNNCAKINDNKVRVSGPAGQTGTYTCSYSVSDGLDTSGIKTATVTVTNQAPTCTNMVVSFNPQFISQGQTFTLGTSVTDLDSNDIPFLAPTDPAGTILTGDIFRVDLTDTKKLYFKPNSNTGDRNYRYKVTDGISKSSECNFKILVNSLDSSDFNQAYDVHWNSTNFQLDFLSKFTGMTFKSVLVNPAGSVQVVNQKALFTPLRKVYIDTFVLLVTDGNIDYNVTVTVTTYNSNPTASVPAQSMNWGTSKTINLLQNYQDKDLTDGFESIGRIVSLSTPVRGSVVLSGYNALYTAPSLYVGSDSFQATVTDGLTTVTFTISLTMTNSPPTVSNRDISVLWRDHAAGVSIDLSTGSSDPENNPLTFSVTAGSLSPSSAGTVSSSGNIASAKSGSSVYLGKFTFAFTASDGIVSTPGLVGVTVYNNMATPIADSVSVHWRQTNVALDPLRTFAASYKDSDNDNLTLMAVRAQKGTVSIHASKTTLIYNAPSNSIGSDVVTYRFTDGAQSLEDSRTVVNVNLVNTNPSAANQLATTKWNTDIQVPLTSACSDADSWDGPFVSFNGILSNVNGGSVSVSNRIVTFSPSFTANQFSLSGNVYSATGSFNFQCTDGLATVTGLTSVNVINNAPTGSAKPQITINRDYTRTSYDILWSDMATWSDADGNTVTLIKFTSSDPSITISTIGSSIRLTTPRDVTGVKTISFKLFDGLHESINTISIGVNFLNTAPTCNVASVTLAKNQVYDLRQLLSASDINNDVLTSSLSTSIPAEFGSTSGTVFTAARSRSGVTSVNYVTSDGQLTSSPCTITITILNNAPVALDKSFNFKPSANNLIHTVTYTATDADGDSLTYSSPSNTCVSGSLATSFVISSSGVLTFTRKSTAVTGMCTMTVVVNDNNNPSASGTATISITITSTPAAAIDDRFQINQGQTIRILVSQILANDNDEYGSTASLTFVSFSCPTDAYCHKTPNLVNVNGQQAIEVDSDQKTCQADKFRYTMRTGLGAEYSADVYIEFKNCYCTAKIDFVFLYDSSGSIGSANFNLMRDLGKRITGRMKIAEDAIKVSIIRFHDYGVKALPLTSNANLVNDTFTNMFYDAGWTATISGLRVAVDALRPANGGRADADKVIYVLTDGLGNIPCSCGDCQNEWSSTPSTFSKTVQQDILNTLSGTARTNALQNMCAYKYVDNTGMTGRTCSQCSWTTYSYCLPCADAVPICQKINTWKRDANGVVPNDPDNPYNGNNKVQWKIVAMAVGDAMTNVWGARQIQGMNYDPTRAITVSWSDLSKTMNEIVDQSCNQVNVQLASTGN